MIPKPIALGLFLCEKVIFEEGTKNVTLVSLFTSLNVDRFPFQPQKFALFAALTDGLGDGIIEVVVTRLETDERIYMRQYPVHFPDRRVEVRTVFRINECPFPAAGRYQFTLLLDGEWLAQRDLQVTTRNP